MIARERRGPGPPVGLGDGLWTMLQEGDKDSVVDTVQVPDSQARMSGRTHCGSWPGTKREDKRSQRL